MMVTSMPLPRRIVLGVFALLPLAAPLPSAAAPADCSAAIGFAQIVADAGEQASIAKNAIAASDLAARSRIPAIDAARYAKACNCPEAIEPLADAALAAQRTSTTINLVGVQQYGATIKKNADRSIEALRRCAGR
jgi:hypothetical protein